MRNPSRSASAASRTPGVVHNDSSRDFKSSPENSSLTSSAAIGSTAVRPAAARGGCCATGGGGGGGAGGGGAVDGVGPCSGIGGGATLARDAGGAGDTGAAVITPGPSRPAVFPTRPSAADGFEKNAVDCTSAAPGPPAAVCPPQNRRA